MNAFDHARRIVSINCPGRQVLVVSLVNEAWRFPLLLTPSAQHADQVALIARQIIAAEVAAAMRNEDCRIAAEIDQRVLSGEMRFPQEASILCRQLAELHILELNKGDGQTDRQQPTGDRESIAPSWRYG